MTNLRVYWKRSQVIRPAFWACYRKTIGKVRSAYSEYRRGKTLTNVLPPIYAKAAAERPVDPDKIVFCVYRGTTLPDSFTLVKKALEEDKSHNWKISVTYLNQAATKSKVFYKKAETFLADIADAAIVFLDEANTLTSCIEKRPETRFIQLWHACGAFKKFGMSTADKIFGSSAKMLKAHPNYRNLDLITISSPEVKWAYIEAMSQEENPDVVQATGISRTDVFYDEEFLAAARERVYKEFPAARDKKVILYAPTFRGRVAFAQAPVMLDFEKMAKALGDEYVLISKHHPFVKELPKIPASLEGTFARDLTKQCNIEDLLITADVCISDYSSLVFEYSLFERPMLFFAFDLKEYDDWRGFYYPYDEMTPGPVCTTNEEMIDYIQHLDERFDQQAVHAFREKFMSSCDGHATERIMKIVLNT